VVVLSPIRSASHDMNRSAQEETEKREGHGGGGGSRSTETKTVYKK
jgi:hypothetical protein